MRLRARQRLRAALLVGSLSAVAVASLWSCDDKPPDAIERTITSTVTLGASVARVTIESWTPLSVSGAVLRTDLFAELEVTLTASSSTVARRLADELTIEVERPSSTDVIVRVRPPRDAMLYGILRVRLPAQLAVEGIVHSGTAEASGLEGPVAFTAQGGVRVTDARDDVTAIVTSGNVSVDTRLPPTHEVRVEVGKGDVELRLPLSLSAQIQADVTTRGEVLIDHPELQPAAGIYRTRYRAELNGGLSTVRVLTQVGNIILRAR